MSIDLSAKIKNIEITPAIMNASGIFSFLPTLYRISDSLGAVVVKGIGYNERPGYETPIFTQVSDDIFLNAVGLSGPGYRALKPELEEYYPKFKSKSKHVGVQIFADSPEKLGEMAKYLEDVCDFFEVNISCPNQVGDEKIGVDIGRDPELVKKYTGAVRNTTEKPIVVKLSPGPYIDDNIQRNRIREIGKAAESEGADAISAINTISGGMKIDIYARKPVLAARYGGASGRGIKSIGVGCVYTLYESIGIPIIGVGGIRTAEDAMEYIQAGASAVQLGTGFMHSVEFGSNTKELKFSISSLVYDLENLIKKLNASSLRELVGVTHGK